MGKNEQLKRERSVTFEEALYCIMHDGLLDIIEHPRPGKYPNQRVFVVNIRDYVYLVPFVETADSIFLKTIIPSRKMASKYLGGKSDETQ